MSDEPTGKPGEGTPPDNKAGEGTAASKTFSQDELNAILAREKKDWQKTHKEDFDKAKAHDELLAKQKEREDAEKSELQKAIEERDQLKPQAERAKTLEEKFKALLDKKIESIPDDKKSLVPRGLGVEDTLEWIETNATHLFEKDGVSAPSGTSPAQGKPDPLRERALKLLDSQYPANSPIRKDKDKWEAKVQFTMELLNSRTSAPQ